MNLPKLLDELEKLEKDATPGPWSSDDPGQSCGMPCTPDGCHDSHESGMRYLDGPSMKDGSSDCFEIPDGDLIAQSRNALPVLIEALRDHIEVVRQLEHLMTINLRGITESHWEAVRFNVKLNKSKWTSRE